MKKAMIEQMDNGYLLTLESDSMDKPKKWVENKLRRIFTQLEFFFLDGKGALKIEK